MKRTAPKDAKALAGDLGISEKQLAKLAQKHGTDTVSVLQRWWNDTRDEPRYLGRTGGYTSSPFAALHTSEAEDGRHLTEPESVPDEYQRVVTMEAHGRWASYMDTERADEQRAQELRSLNGALRQVVAEAVRTGVDPKPLLEGIKGLITAQKNELDKAA